MVCVSTTLLPAAPGATLRGVPVARCRASSTTCRTRGSTVAAAASAACLILAGASSWRRRLWPQPCSNTAVCSAFSLIELSRTLSNSIGLRYLGTCRSNIGRFIPKSGVSEWLRVWERHGRLLHPKVWMYTTQLQKKHHYVFILLHAPQRPKSI